MSGSKLVENLAESLVNELSESKTLDLMNDQKFSEFTDLLWEILDRVDKAEDREKEKEKELEKEKSNEDETLKSVKALADKITEYFGKSGESNGKTDKILNIVQNLQKDEKEGGESDEDKKKKKLGLAKKTKEQKDIEETKEKIEQEKKDEEKAKLDKQTVQMLNKLTKDFEKSEKDRKKQNSWVRKGLKRVERKIGSLIWKALKKFKGILLIGALIFFRKPIINFFKGIWEKYLKPHVAPLVEKLGEKVGGLFNFIKGWFESTFPEFDNWLKNEYPKIKAWFKENWENIKEWFTETIPNFVETVLDFMDTTKVGKYLKGKYNESKKDRNIKKAQEIESKQYGENGFVPMSDEDRVTYYNALADASDAEAQAAASGQYEHLWGMFTEDSNGNWGLSFLNKNQQKEQRVQAAKEQAEHWRALARGNQISMESNTTMPVSTPSDSNNDNLPEYGNPAGGMGGQYSAADVDSGKNTNVVDNSSTTNVVNHSTINNIYNVQQTESSLHQ